MRLKQQLAFFFKNFWRGLQLSATEKDLNYVSQSSATEKDLNYVPALGCGVMQSLAVTSPDETHGFKTKGDRYNQIQRKKTITHAMI